jgi:4-hydroxy-2-oxoheptanedioate aldolase
MPLGRLGAWCSIPSPYVVEILSSCGFDWLCLDLQHGFIGSESLLPMLQAASIRRTPMLGRVPTLEPGIIGRVLDAGAAGVIVPLVNTAAKAREAVRACRYPPHGTRSWGPARLTLADRGYSASKANDAVQCVVMIETTEAIRNIDEIVQVDGVTAVFVGPSDLAADMTLPPRYGAIPGEHAQALGLIADTCHRHGMPVGIFGGSPDAVSQYSDMGYQFFAVTTDAALIRAGAESYLRTDGGALRGAFAEDIGGRPRAEGATP